MLVLGMSACDALSLSDVSDAGGAGGTRSDAGSASALPDGGNSADGGALPDAGVTERCPGTSVPAERVVQTHRGPVQGMQDEDVLSFRGIPYAAPPVEERRWKAPEEPACWSEPRDGSRYGAQCPQLGTTVVSGEEDCLFLNVWTPSVMDAVRRPVMFFIHGGAEILGAANQQVLPGFNLYDGSRLTSRHDVVVVTANHRLGALGFLAHPALSDENPRSVSGNYGLLDLVAALRWVQLNIASFGGDPGNVMIFGESAGALNTCALLASPLAAGLFHSALMESGDCVAPPLAERERAGQQVAVALGCTSTEGTAACLRNVSAASLVLETQVDLDVFKVWDLPFGPSVDGYALTGSPVDVMAAGQHNKVPFIIGSNAHETELFLPAVINTCLDYYALIGLAFPNVSDAVTDEYRCLDQLLPRWSAVDASTDLLFTCPARRAARAAAAHQTAPVWRYHYRNTADYGALTLMRAFHASELPYVFGTHVALGYLPTPREQTLSDEMMAYWARFARTHDPNGGAAVRWPAMGADAAPVLTLDDESIAVVDGIADTHCDFWDALGP